MAKKEDKKPVGFDPKAVQVGGDSILERLVPHVKKIVIAIVITAAVLSVVFFFKWLKDRKLEKQTDGLAEVIDVGDRPVRVPGEAADPKDKQPSFADDKERANAVLETLGKQETPIASPGYKAGALLQAGRLDDAIAEYKKGQAEPGLDGVLAREGLGLALEAKAAGEKDPAARNKGYEDALAAFQAMQPDDKGARRDYALYHQGRLLIELGKLAEAKTALEKAKELGKDTALVELIDMRLVSLGAG
ncbi:MAG TPA: hypothetical protein VGF94_08350 [Kofleriaceae bacterium]